MVGQMSSKSKIYHRSGCRYIQAIDETSLIAFDLDDGRIDNLRPCKYCCNLKRIYKECKPELRTIFEDLDIVTEYDGEFILAHTAWYNWKVSLKESNQNLVLYREISHPGTDICTLSRCQDMGRVRNLSTVMQYIACEEKVAPYPEQYRKQALQIERYAKEKHVQIEFNGTDLYILTDMAAWKIAYGYHFDWFKLLHCPYDGKPMTMEEAKTAHYHVQMDVPRNQSPYKHLQYIVKHDMAKKTEQTDYRQLPKKNKQQKKYYRQAHNRAIRKSIGRVFDILAELEAKEEFAKVSFG